MSQSRDSSPVYYREIQKNAYLKRIPDEGGGSKIRPLGLKKPPLKPMWTQLCVHNGRTPYLEQYRDPVSARAHKPVWRASLLTARHVTASVTPRDNEYDFLIDTHQGPVRMLAPNWETMQDWVATLRNKLHELKIVSLCENVYNAPPVPLPPRAAARDPTSPLPPTPPLPPDRVPGIDLTSVHRAPTIPETDPEHIEEPTNLTTDQPTSVPTTQPTSPPTSLPTNTEIDISNWDDLSLPSTSQAPTSVAKICGQNICLDDSIFKRDTDESDQEFEDDGSEISYKQTVVVATRSAVNLTTDRPSNVTVIQVSNKEPPHTAIPVIGPEVDVFDFEFKSPAKPNYVNIVNTENVQTSNDYGTVFNESDYGHLSLTTTVSLTGDVNLTGDVKEELYEKLCLASTDASPLPIRRLRQEKVRKSSLPNLDTVNTTYEYLFLGQNGDNSISNANITTNSTRSTNNTSTSSNSTYLSTNRGSMSSNCTFLSANSTISNPLTTVNSTITSNSASLSSNSAQMSTISTSSKSVSTNSTPISNSLLSNSVPIPNSALISNSVPIPNSARISNSNTLPNSNSVTVNTEINSNTRHVNSVPVNNMSSNTRSLRSNIERTQSQNSYDAVPRRVQNESKNNGKEDKTEPQHKPIWKRGLTELSLLTRLRGIGQGKRTDSPGRNDNDRNGVTSPPKLVHRSRPETRVDRTRRRSSSLTNGEIPQSVCSGLTPLRARQAAALAAAQRRGAAVAACVPTAEPPLFADYNKQVWVAWWGVSGGRCGGRIGDRVCGLRAAAPKDAQHAKQLINSTHAHGVDLLFHRVPLGKIYVVNKRDQESIGLKLDNECNITGVEPDSPAARAGIPPLGKWAVTEVNNRAINLLKGGEEDMNRISLHGTEASVLIQPSALVKKLRSALKGNKTLLGLR